MIALKRQTQAITLASEMHLMILISWLIACERRTLAGHSKLCTTLRDLMFADDPTQQSISGLKDLDHHEEGFPLGVLDGILRSVPHIDLGLPTRRTSSSAGTSVGIFLWESILVGRNNS